MRRRYKRIPDYAVRFKEALNAAFADLRKKGYVARQAFSCCGSCGAYELGQYFEAKGVAEADQKAVWYSRQNREEATEDGHVWLNWAGDASVICEALRAQGIEAKWDGTENDSVHAYAPECLAVWEEQKRRDAKWREQHAETLRAGGL